MDVRECIQQNIHIDTYPRVKLVGREWQGEWWQGK